MQNLSFLDNLDVAQKFVVEVPEIIWWGARDYMVSKAILVISLSLSQAEQFSMHIFMKYISEN